MTTNTMAENVFNQSITNQHFWRTPPTERLQTSVRGTSMPINTHTHHKIKGIRFGVMSANEVLKCSVTEITQPTLYERALPRTGSMNDTRLGVCERILKCATCTNETLVCDGHTGHIMLAEPVYHAGFMSYIVRILRSVCFFCGQLSVPDDDENLQRLRLSCARGLTKQYFMEATEYLKGKKQCWREECRAPYPKFVQQGLYIRRDWDQAAMSKLGPEEMVYLNPLTVPDVLALLLHIPDDVYAKMGIDVSKSHPSSCIISVLLVPSPNIRPSIMFSDSSKTRGQDGLTHKLQEILKTSQRLEVLNATCAKNPGNKTMALSAQVVRDALQFCVATYYSNDVPVGATPPPISQITGNFAGKRKRVTKKSKKLSEQSRKKQNSTAELPCGGDPVSANGVADSSCYMDNVDPAISAQAIAAPGTICLTNTSYVPSAHMTTAVRKRATASSSGTGSSANNAADRSIMSRMKGKKGRIRGNNMGKRVNFCSRTTITPDNTLEVDEVGMPVETALILTREEIVNTFNYERLSLRVRCGPGKLSGATSITTVHGKRISLEFVKNLQDLRLQIGDRVERPLQDGEYVLFNREPTLHKNYTDCILNCILDILNS